MRKIKAGFILATDVVYGTMLAGTAALWLMSNVGGIGYKVVGDKHFVVIAHRFVECSATYYMVSRVMFVAVLGTAALAIALFAIRGFVTRQDKRPSDAAAGPDADATQTVGLRTFLRKAAVPLPAVAEATEINCMVEDVITSRFRLDDRKWNLGGRHLHLTAEH